MCLLSFLRFRHIFLAQRQLLTSLTCLQMVLEIKFRILGLLARLRLFRLYAFYFLSVFSGGHSPPSLFDLCFTLSVRAICRTSSIGPRWPTDSSCELWLYSSLCLWCDISSFLSATCRVCDHTFQITFFISVLARLWKYLQLFRS